MADVNASRTYNSPRRDRAALATRRAVLAAAHRLFVEQGYARTTVADIAQAAEVSRPTVYAVGSKAELLKLARDVAMAGDDTPVSVADRPAVTAIRDAPDAEQAIRLHARNIVSIVGRYADLDHALRQAAGADPDLAALWRASEEQRLTAAGMVIDLVLAKGRLRPGLDRARAIDLLWLYMAPGHLHRLRERGWDDQAYEAWLAETLCTQLLPPPIGST